MDTQLIDIVAMVAVIGCGGLLLFKVVSVFAKAMRQAQVPAIPAAPANRSRKRKRKSPTDPSPAMNCATVPASMLEARVQ